MFQVCYRMDRLQGANFPDLKQDKEKDCQLKRQRMNLNLHVLHGKSEEAIYVVPKGGGGTSSFSRLNFDGFISLLGYCYNFNIL